MMRKVFVLHENDEWVQPLRGSLAYRGVPFEEWFLAEGELRLDDRPPEGVFYNRMSASSHTRDHRFAPEFTGLVLAWLHRHGRRVVNGERALQLEVSKVAQYMALSSCGVPTPRTVAVVGRDDLSRAARSFGAGPVLLKPNRGGKGEGVRLFENAVDVMDFARTASFAKSVDGTWLLQEYIEPRDGSITRAEFIGGKFFYAVRVDTSDGFELCPADHCEEPRIIDPAGEQARPKFSIVDDVDPKLVAASERFLARNEIEIAAVEFVTDDQGKAYAYDVNTNTNYNADAERRAGRFGMDRIARFLGGELARLEKARRLS